MNTAIERRRTQIATAAERFFGRSVQIDERALQSLEILPARGGPPKPQHIWVALAEAFPAMATYYSRLGFDPNDAKFTAWPRKLLRADTASYIHEVDFGIIVRSIFTVYDPVSKSATLTEAANDVVAGGHLTVRGLALSILDSARITPLEGKVTNVVIRHLGRGIGLPLGRRWTPQVETFRNQAVQMFNEMMWTDPEHGQQQFVLFHDGRRFRIRPFATDGAYLLQEEPLPDGSLWVARGNTLQPPTRFSEEATAELEHLINGDAAEREFQSFFERHPEFLLALGDYRSVHPQVVLHEDDGGTLIPDFFLEKLNSHFCDICDLKRANVELVRYQRHRDRFRAAVMEAVAQLSVYRDWFDDRDHRQQFRKRFGLEAYRPKVVLVIGRRASFANEVERIHLESNLPSWIGLTTYDDVVARARQWRRLIVS